MTAKESIKELKRYNPFQLIAMERLQQDVQWGEQNHDDLKWFLILAEEFGEVAKAVVEDTSKERKYSHEALRENLEIELIQTAAVCVAWIECLRRRDLKEFPA